MFVDPASSPLCHNNNDQSSDKSSVENSDEGSYSTVDTTILSTQHYLDKNESLYDRKKRKFLCVLLTIVAILIAMIGTTFWIIYNGSAKPPEYHTEHMTSQPLYTETLSDTFSETHMEMNYSTTPLLTIPTSVLHSTTEIGIQQLVKKVLFIIADGIPADVIENVSVINMKHIQKIGAYTRAYVGGHKGTYTQTATISSPGYMSLLTGTWGNKHNVYDNYVKNPNYHYKNIFRLVKEQQPDKKIGIFSTWTTNRLKLIGEGLSEAGNITFDYKFDGYELDRITYPHDKQSVYIHQIDERVTNETSKCIKTHAPDLSWVYLQYTDDIGHFFGDSEQFNQSIVSLDDKIGRIWDAIDYRMKYHEEDWLMIITTDHGRDPKKGKHHAGQSVRERTTWIMTNSQETNTYFHDFQPSIVDILPTITKFMNFTIPIECERELDGIPLIGNISLLEPDGSLNGDTLNISWTVLHSIGNVTIWLSTSNLFKKGKIDNYMFIDTVPIDEKMVVIDVKQYPSQFYKIVLEAQYNTVNKWVSRQWRRNKT